MALPEDNAVCFAIPCPSASPLQRRSPHGAAGEESIWSSRGLPLVRLSVQIASRTGIHLETISSVEWLRHGRLCASRLERSRKSPPALHRVEGDHFAVVGKLAAPAGLRCMPRASQKAQRRSSARWQQKRHSGKQRVGLREYEPPRRWVSFPHCRCRHRSRAAWLLIEAIPWLRQWRSLRILLRRPGRWCAGGGSGRPW
jgi:hypothetical protein